MDPDGEEAEEETTQAQSGHDDRLSGYEGKPCPRMYNIPSSSEARGHACFGPRRRSRTEVVELIVQHAILSVLKTPIEMN